MQNAKRRFQPKEPRYDQTHGAEWRIEMLHAEFNRCSVRTRRIASLLNGQPRPSLFRASPEADPKIDFAVRRTCLMYTASLSRHQKVSTRNHTQLRMQGELTPFRCAHARTSQWTKTRNSANRTYARGILRRLHFANWLALTAPERIEERDCKIDCDQCDGREVLVARELWRLLGTIPA